MNKKFAYIWTLVLVMIGGMAMGQNNRGSFQPYPATTQRVIVGGDVFGGGKSADVAGKSSVLINHAGDSIGGSVYGGGALANVGTTWEDSTTVNILNGIVNGNVYGGGLGDSTAVGYGGDDDIAALVRGKVYVNIGQERGDPNPNFSFVKINGSVFGCNNVNGTPLDSVFVNIYRTWHSTINLYPDTITDISTASMQKLRNAFTTANTDANYAIKAVYGGGNKASYKPIGDNKTSTVHIYYCNENTIKTVYGGGNAANVGDTTDYGVNIPAHTHLIIDGGRFDQVFGGGNGYSAANPPNHTNPSGSNYNPGANIFGSATTDINGGLYNQVFGGSNQYGNIASASLNINGNSGCVEMILESFCGGNEADMTGGDINATIANCDIRIGTLYGGSNNADILKDGSGNGGNVTLNVLGGNFDYVFGGSKGTSADPADIQGNVTLNLHGGTISSAYGGSDVKGNILGNIAVNVLDTVTTCPLQVDTVYGAGRDAYYTPTNANAVSPVVKIQHATIGHGSGATAVPGCVFGGGKGGDATVKAHPKVIIGELGTINGPDNQPISTVATVTGDVYGGGNAAAVEGGTTVLVQKCNSRAKYVYGGGNAADVNSTKVYITGGTVDTLFGGGHGSITPPVEANVTGNDTISISGGTVGKAFAGSNLNGTIGGRMALNIDKSTASDACDLIVGEVYGGGNQAAGKAGTITIGCTGTWTTSGEHNHTNHNSTDNRIGYELEGIGTVYGGGNMADIGTNENHSNIHLIIQNGIVENVFGGNNTSGDIYGTIQVDIDSIGDCSTNWYVGNVYGGGNLAAYMGSPSVNILRGTVSQNVFGGGKGSTAVVTGTPSVTVGDLAVGHESYKATVLGDVYGGGDAADVETGTPVVLVQKCNSKVGNVYGGGNAADVPATSVTVTGGTISGAVFGGGHGDKDATPTPLAANVTGNTSVTINGGVINQVFGGSNSNGTIGGTISVVVNKEGTCEMHITEVYGGGNYASSHAGNVDIQCTGADDMIYNVYGGANRADIGTSEVPSDITLNITGGRIGNVFGGNNNGGDIHGTITVNVEWNGSCANNYLGNVFGGGNLAEYLGRPAVNIKNGTVSGNVYGGGNGNPEDDTQEPGQTGAPTVTIGDLTVNTHQAIVLGDVYGGGNAAKVTGSTASTVRVLNKANTEIGYVYGGGNAADVPATSVTIAGGTIHNDVFGGGHGDRDDLGSGHSDKQANVDGATSVSVTGAKIDRVFAGSNLNGSIGGNMTLSINKSNDATTDMIIREVYGGGNMAAGKAGTITIGCTGTLADLGSGEHYGVDQEGIRYVYGGANEANIGTSENQSNIVLNINSGIVENVFGGNNTSGAINGTIQVNINKTNDACGWYVGDVYGGGNLAGYTGTPDVNIINGTVSGSVYGGGNEAEVGGGDVAMTGGAVLGGLYGGCNTSGVVGGDITVNITGGTIGADETHRADVFGGGYGDGTSTTGHVTVNFGGTPESFPSDHNEFPKIFGDIYGGSALGSVNPTDGSKATIVNVLNGTLVSDVGTDANGFPVYNGGNVFGGGLGLAGDATKGKVNGTVTVNIGTGTLSGSYTTVTSGEAIIKGNVYGCNNTNGSPQQNVTVNIYHTAHTPDDSATYVGTPPSVLKYALQNVFGGGNQADFRVEGMTATVNIYGCDNTIGRTFGGGNAAATNTVSTMIQGGRINNAFAGGNGEVSAANVYGNATLAIHGGNIGMSFNGSNQNGQISGTSSVTIDDEGCGDVQVNEHFCGNNFSDYYGDIVQEIACPGMYVKNLYGGCKQAKVLKYPTKSEIEANLSSFPDDLIELFYAHVEEWDDEYAGKGGNIHLTVTGGVYENIYGGSQGKIDPANPSNNISADIAGHILLEIHGGTVSNAVYGGSHILGRVGGTITVNIEDKYPNDGCPLDLSIADIYGGGNMADYTTPTVSGHTETHDFPHVNIKNATVKNVFGGGLAAEVKGNPQIRIKKGAKVLGNVYGGGNMGEVKDNTATTEVQEGNPRVIINGKDESDNPTGDPVLYPGYTLPELPSEP